jgi:REP element-mobilizing transposase RayT
VAHDRRAPIRARQPQHVTLRVAQGVPSLRRRPTLGVVHQAIRAAGHAPDFRIVHFNVLGNHIHLIVETSNAGALAHAMQGFCVRLAKGVNRALGRTGTVFAERYHARALATPTEVRNALRYVLLNGNRHEVELGAEVVWFGVDPYSSAAWFDGWADERWRYEVPDTPRPTALAATWLLRDGWKKGGGPIAFDDTPGRRSTERRQARSIR